MNNFLKSSYRLLSVKELTHFQKTLISYIISVQTGKDKKGKPLRFNLTNQSIAERFGVGKSTVNDAITILKKYDKWFKTYNVKTKKGDKITEKRTCHISTSTFEIWLETVSIEIEEIEIEEEEDVTEPLPTQVPEPESQLELPNNNNTIEFNTTDMTQEEMTTAAISKLAEIHMYIAPTFSKENAAGPIREFISNQNGLRETQKTILIQHIQKYVSAADEVNENEKVVETSINIEEEAENYLKKIIDSIPDMYKTKSNKLFMNNKIIEKIEKSEATEEVKVIMISLAENLAA